MSTKNSTPSWRTKIPPGISSETKAGFVAVVGRPNAGKSTLLNWLVDEKLAMVSQKAQATRKRMNIIVMHEDSQIIFVDTPGLHEKEKLLNRFMMDEALKAIGDCDLTLFVAAATDTTNNYQRFLEKFGNTRPHIVVLNKIDTTDHEKLLRTLKSYQPFQQYFKAVIPVSSTKGSGKEGLLDAIAAQLPVSPFLFDPDDLTTDSLRDIYKELIRESLFENLSNEIPYESDVIIDKVEEGIDMDRIKATLIVEKPSQKIIVVGKGGATVKRIGREARVKCEAFGRKKIFLELFVAVRRNWTKKRSLLKDAGYLVD